MLTLNGNLFYQIGKADAICITTNGITKYDGAAVCGAGIAKAATLRWPDFAVRLGKLLKQNGNITQEVLKDQGTSIIALPTKEHWKNQSTIPLIVQSCQALVQLADQNQWTKVCLPMPGCNNGGLSWYAVAQALKPVLDDRFTVVDLKLPDETEEIITSVNDKQPIQGEYDFKNVPLDDPKVWRLIANGRTKGVFQLETQLGQSWSKIIRPTNINELSALIALIRPGPLESLMSEQYARRKNGEEAVEYFHPALEPILNETYGCLCYQEQILAICIQIAGFSEVEADLARKAVGKKKPEEMNKVKTMFLEGAKNKGVVTEEEASEIFSWIEKSVRYSFNKSHSVSYAMIGYLSAFQKTHFPHEFYTAWLTYSKFKPSPKEEVFELVQDARFRGITVKQPNLLTSDIDFKIDEDRAVLFGLSHIRSIGDAAIKKVSKLNFDTFPMFLKNITQIHKNVAEALIKSGACDFYGLERIQMLKHVHILLGRGNKDNKHAPAALKKMSQKELSYCIANVDKLGIQDTLLSLKDKAQASRQVVIQQKIDYLNEDAKDSNRQKALWEKIYLGLSLTCSAADDVDVTDVSTVSCRDAYKALPNAELTLHVVVDAINNKRTSAKAKTPDQAYCYLTVSDNTGVLSNVVCWPDLYEEYKSSLAEGIVIAIYCKKNVWNQREQLIVQRINFLE
ncbi:MAG: hypothetical protein WC942_06790 [Clostridia bacterium]|jgi:DNA polymerase III alpha subunit